MTTVNGNTAEPGYTLDDNSWLDECPSCDAMAKHRSYEVCDGSINVYQAIICHHCGYNEDNGRD